MTSNDRLMPSSLDRAISTPERDAFGHRHYAQALRSLIESASHSPPFSIGLLGGWGTGKSTIKELYLRELSEDQTSDGPLMRSDRIHPITFNAWRFGGEGIKRALLRHVFLELGGDDETLKDKLFRQLHWPEQRIKPLGRYVLETFAVWGIPLIPIVVLFLLAVLGVTTIVYLFAIRDQWAITTITTLFIVAFTFLLKQVKFAPPSPFIPITRIELPNVTAEQYEDLLVTQLKEYKAGRGSKTQGKYCERLVVFVDDLDRLSADEMVQGLDAIRTFMEIPTQNLPTGLGVVFVISCDEDKVADALTKGRRQEPDLPGTIFTRFDARRYLDRIFQFRLEIPPFPRSDMRQYALDRLKELPGIKEDLDEKNIALETLVDRMIHVDVQTPRNALQIVNAFAQAWWLAKKRETEDLGVCPRNTFFS
jgi:KAP family P-loop domain